MKLILFLLLSALFIIPTRAQEIITLSDLQVDYKINGDHITATFQATVTEPAPLTWLIPLPEQTEQIEIVALPVASEPNPVRFAEPRRYCGNIHPPGFTNPVENVSHTVLESTERTVLTADQVQEWVSSHGKPTVDLQQLLTDYPDHVFFALYFDAPELGDTATFSFAYTADTLTLPLRAFYTQGGVTVVMQGAGRYLPSNVPQTEVDFSALRIDDPGTFPPLPNATNNYEILRDSAAHNAFVTESAHRLYTGDYQTSLYGYISQPPELDPTFVPVPGLADVSNVITVADHVDPITYWGCSTRPLQSLLDDWVVSEIETTANYHVTVIAAEPVTREDIEAFGRGEFDLPMAVFYNNPDSTSGSTLEEVFLNHFKLENLPEDREIRTTKRFLPYDSLGQVSVLATKDDLEIHAEMAETMVNAFAALPYYTGNGLLYTLFMDGGLILGYPEGWIESATDDTVTISPETGVGVTIRFGRDVIADPAATFYYYGNHSLNPLIDTLAQQYHIEDTSLIKQAVENPTCTFRIPPLPFEHDGRKGWLYIVPTELGYVIELSAPLEKFDRYAGQLQRIGESYDIVWGCG